MPRFQIKTVCPGRRTGCGQRLVDQARGETKMGGFGFLRVEEVSEGKMPNFLPCPESRGLCCGFVPTMPKREPQEDLVTILLTFRLRRVHILTQYLEGAIEKMIMFVPGQKRLGDTVRVRLFYRLGTTEVSLRVNIWLSPLTSFPFSPPLPPKNLKTE